MFLEQPGFFPQFLIRSMASMVVGEETLNELKEVGILNGITENLLGVFLGCGYLAALVIHVRDRLYEKTLVPLMLLFAGMGNHAIVLISRYIFARVDYGMSSRYALQYQAGLLGIVLTFALAEKITAGCVELPDRKEETGQIETEKPVNTVIQDGIPRPEMQEKKKQFSVGKIVMIAFCAMLLIGHGYTDYREIEKAPYREAYGERIGNAALQYEILSDDEIRETFDYRKSREESAADVRRALRILKENHWNIFSRVEY